MASKFAAQHGEAVGRDRGLIAQVAVGTPVEIAQLYRCAHGLNDLHGLRNDLLANTVAGDDGDALFLG